MKQTIRARRLECELDAMAAEIASRITFRFDENAGLFEETFETRPREREILYAIARGALFAFNWTRYDNRHDDYRFTSGVMEQAENTLLSLRFRGREIQGYVTMYAPLYAILHDWPVEERDV